MIVTKLSIDYHNGWSVVSKVASFIGGIILLFLFVWGAIRLYTKKEVKEMPVKSRLIVESISRLLFLYWIYITLDPIIAIVWVAFVLWDSIRSIRQLSGQ